MSEESKSEQTIILPKNRKECSLPEPFTEKQYYERKTYYQILLIEFERDKEDNINWKTKLITKTKENFSQEPQEQGDDLDKLGYRLDQHTEDTTKESREKGGLSAGTVGYKTIGSTLPTPGCMLNKGLLDVLLKRQQSPFDEYSPNDKHSSVDLNNFYETFRVLLHTRKMSQLIAKTWDATLTAYDIISPKVKKLDNSLLKLALTESDIKPEIFDGLIARELFLLSNSWEPDELIPKNLGVYYPLRSGSEPVDEARFIILPSSKGWQTIGLSLLMAGQVYYYTDKDGNLLIVDDQGGFCQKKGEDFVKYDKEVYCRQVNKSILSTGEIVMKYALDISLSLYKGDIKELDIRGNTSSPAYLAVLPYPAIPREINLSHKQIREWANANDKVVKLEENDEFNKRNNQFPFYIQNDNDEYLIGVQNYTPPYAYLPSSCS